MEILTGHFWKSLQDLGTFKSLGLLIFGPLKVINFLPTTHIFFSQVPVISTSSSRNYEEESSLGLSWSNIFTFRGRKTGAQRDEVSNHFTTEARSKVSCSSRQEAAAVHRNIAWYPGNLLVCCVEII